MNEPTKPTDRPTTSVLTKEPASAYSDKHGTFKLVLSCLALLSYMGEPHGVPHLLTLVLALLYFGLDARSALARRSIFGVAFSCAAIGWLSVLTLCSVL